MIITTRPIVFFDLETTGLNPGRDQIIELSYIKIYPEGEEEAATYRFNVTVPISPDAEKTHGITREQLNGCPFFRDRAAVIAEVFRGADIGGFNVSFDINFILEEFSRAGTEAPFPADVRIVDAYRMYCNYQPRTLSAAYRHLTGEELEDSHSAEADITGTIRIVEELLKRDVCGAGIGEITKYAGTDRIADFAGKFIWNEGELYYNFGEYKNQPVTVNPMRAKFWLNRDDFPKQSKAVLKSFLLSKKLIQEM